MANKELLAPVGSYEAMIAAVNAGCDAIYTGGTLFGARAFANNFNNDELIDVINYCHLRNVAVYLTVNTLLSDDEIEEYLFDYLKPLYEAGLDAVIIQDIGVLEYISKHFPRLPIHLSTQFTSTTHISSKLFEKYNITRVVTPRELSLKEIEEYAANTGLEIETFIHGALCYCYSGQCLMSALVGGRSGNRGKCAQPCRKDYLTQNNKGNKAILSLKDLCTLDMIPQLMESSIYSFKIEGRMKKPEYVGIVVSVYRKYMNLYDKLGAKRYKEEVVGNKEYEQDKIKLSDIYNRGGFTQGYMVEHNSKDINCCDLVSHYGTKCGYITRISVNDFSFKALLSLNPQDVLQIRDDRQELIYEFTLKDGVAPGGIYKGRYQKGLKLREKMQVYRVRNNNLLNEINKKIIEVNKKIPVSIYAKLEKNKPIRLVMSANGHSVELEGDVCEKAIKSPVTKENVKSKLIKLGNTSFSCEEIEISMDEELFISATTLNELRRKTVEKLEKEICNCFTRDSLCDTEVNIKIAKPEQSEHFILTYALDITNAENVIEAAKSLGIMEKTLLAVEMVNFTKEQLKDILMKAKNKAIAFCLVLPWIIRYKDMDRIKEIKDFISSNNVDYLMVRNYEELELIKTCILDTTKVIADTSMYAYNSIAIEKLKSIGVNLVSAPIEAYNSNADIVTVYGNRPVMVSAGCVKKTLDNCNKNNESIEFCNDKGDKYFAKCVCEYCMNMIFTNNESKFHYDLKKIAHKGQLPRLNFTKEDKNTIKDVLEKTYKEISCSKE